MLLRICYKIRSNLYSFDQKIKIKVASKIEKSRMNFDVCEVSSPISKF